MTLLRVRRVAQRLEFLNQLRMPVSAFLWRGKLECESRGLKTNYARIVAAQMLEEARAQVVGFADVDPEGVEKTVNAGRFRCVFQDTFALKQIAAVTRFRKRYGSPVFDAFSMYFRFELER